MVLASHTSSAWTTYGLFVLETVAALAVIAAAGWAVVRFGGGRLGARGKNRRMKLLERLVLEPRRSVHLVEVDGETLLIGTSERSVHLLKRISDQDAEDLRDAAKAGS
jgi:flagellar biosynthetic protein FliO